jgi:hypothetical protein
MIEGFIISILIFLGTETCNCLLPTYNENIWTEQSDGSYHENTGWICSWEKEDFVYNAKEDTWELSPNANRKRSKKGSKRRGGRGLR